MTNLGDLIAIFIICFMIAYSIYSIERLKRENERLKKNLEYCLEAFKDINKGQEKVFKEVREMNKDLIEWAKKLEG